MDKKEKEESKINTLKSKLCNDKKATSTEQENSDL